MMRSSSRSVFWLPLLPELILALGAGSILACGPSDSAEITLVLLRAEDIRAESPLLRAGGLDREHVIQAQCEILNSSRHTIQSEVFEIKPDSLPGEQEGRLRNVPEGEGYFARILGYENPDSVYECGVTGPFTLVGGSQHQVTIVIDRPPAGDAFCQAICSADADCTEGAYCPSPCARNTPGECIRALCLPE